MIVDVLLAEDHTRLARFVNLHVPPASQRSVFSCEPLRSSARRRATSWVRVQTMQRSLIALRETSARLQVLVGDTNFKSLAGLHAALGLAPGAYEAVAPPVRNYDDYIIVLQSGWVVRPLVMPMGISYKVPPPSNWPAAKPTRQPTNPSANRRTDT